MTLAEHDERLRGWAIADLAEVRTLIADVDLLLPSRRARSTERTVLDEEAERAAAEAFKDRAARLALERTGLQALSPVAAPLTIGGLQLLDRARTTVLALTVELRSSAGLGPLWSYVEDPRTDDVVRLALDWLQPALRGLDHDELVRAAEDIRRALNWLRTAYGHVRETAKLRAPCPQCNRMGLRIDYTAADRTAWFVTCVATDCRARWMWAAWDDLGQRIGIDVLEAVEAAA